MIFKQRNLSDEMVPCTTYKGKVSFLVGCQEDTAAKATIRCTLFGFTLSAAAVKRLAILEGETKLQTHLAEGVGASKSFPVSATASRPILRGLGG